MSRVWLRAERGHERSVDAGGGFVGDVAEQVDDARRHHRGVNWFGSPLGQRATFMCLFCWKGAGVPPAARRSKAQVADLRDVPRQLRFRPCRTKTCGSPENARPLPRRTRDSLSKARRYLGACNLDAGHRSQRPLADEHAEEGRRQSPAITIAAIVLTAGANNAPVARTTVGRVPFGDTGLARYERGAN
jgi:hypothetical protein